MKNIKTGNENLSKFDPKPVIEKLPVNYTLPPLEISSFILNVYKRNRLDFWHLTLMIGPLVTLRDVLIKTMHYANLTKTIFFVK